MPNVRILFALRQPALMAVAALSVVLPPVAAQSNGDRSTMSGVYTDGQARRGEETYKVYCVSCHSPKDYSGDTFKTNWVSRRAFDLFETIRSQMPEDAPGSLQRQEYVDVVAYIFSLNGFPTGSAELVPDDAELKKVKIDAPPADLSARRTHGSLPAAHGMWSAKALRLRLLR